MRIIELALLATTKIPLTVRARILSAHLSGDVENTIAKSAIGHLFLSPPVFLVNAGESLEKSFGPVAVVLSMPKSAGLRRRKGQKQATKRELEDNEIFVQSRGK
jgi:hypothetical protein